MSKGLQAKRATPGPGPSSSPRADASKAQDQIHEWLADYSNTRDPALRDSIIQAALPLVKRIAYGLARRSTDPVEDLIQVGRAHV